MVVSSCDPIPVTVETLPSFVLKCLSSSPHKIALVDGKTGKEVTFEEVVSLIKKLSVGLNELGLNRGDVVGFYAPNCFEYIYSLLAVMLNGAVAATVNPSYKTYELSNAINLIEARWWLTTSHLHRNLIQSLHETNTPAKGVILLDSDQNETDAILFSSLVNSSSSTSSVPDVVINPKTDAAMIMFSSGTTGLPKAVILSHYNLVSTLTVLGTVYSKKDPQHKPGEQPVSLIVLPFFHIFGMIGVMMLSLVSCHKLIILPRFTPDEAFRSVEKYKVTLFAMVPTLIVYMCKNPDTRTKYDLSSIRRIMTGSAPLSEQIEKEFRTLYKSGRLAQGYGMTETSLAVILNLPGKPLKNNSCGQILPNNKVSVRCLKTKKDLGPNKKGEIYIKSPQVMLGYLNDHQATRETLDEEGWLRTGDIGYYDEEEYFYIIDRIKELIKYKGFQIAPAEIEAFLLTHPSIAEAAVVGVPDMLAGELPKAFVVKRPGTELTEAKVNDFVLSKLSHYKELKGGVEFVDSIPKGETGKILRRKLRDMNNSVLLSKL